MELNNAASEPTPENKRSKADVSRDYSQAAMELGDLVHRMKNQMPNELNRLEKKLNDLIFEMQSIDLAELASKNKPVILNAVS